MSILLCTLYTKAPELTEAFMAYDLAKKIDTVVVFPIEQPQQQQTYGLVFLLMLLFHYNAFRILQIKLNNHYKQGNHHIRPKNQTGVLHSTRYDHRQFLLF